MNNTVKRVSTAAKIIFSNGSNYTIPFTNPHDSQNPDLLNYGTNCKLKQALYKANSTNVIGNICGSTLSIEGKSLNKLLIPSNENSQYYSYMNNTAKIEVKVTGDDNVETNMGVYYVDSWEGTESSDNYDTFNITCVDLMSKIKNIKITKVRINQQMKFSQYLKQIIDTLNDSLPVGMKVIYTMSTLEKMDKIYNDNWNMYYNNINTDSIENIFNELSQNTLSYVWIDRNNELQVDTLLDDVNEVITPVCELSGSTNLLSYSSEQGDICAYSGIECEFISGITYKDEQVLDINNIHLSAGNNTINTQLNSDRVIKVNLIEITPEDASVKCSVTGFLNFRNYIEINVKSLGETNVSIKVYGKLINESYDTLTKYKSDNDKNSLLSIKNHVLRSEDIPTYVDNFLRLISMKNSSLQVEGWINPQVKLSNMIEMTGTRLGISNYYKVIELEFNLVTNYRCRASLMKTIDAIEAIETLLTDDHNECLNILNGTIDEQYDFFSPTTQAQVTAIDNYVGNEIDSLYAFL